VKYLSVEMEKMKFEGKQSYKNSQNADRRGNFRRPNISPQILPREPCNRDRDDQKIQNLLQNNLVADEEGDEGELDIEIHCLGDTSPFPHITQSAYEESLMDDQINELSRGEKANSSPNKYNLRFEKKEEKLDIPNQPSKAEKPSKDIVNGSKEKKMQNPSPVAKGPVPEVREILNPPSYFIFEHDIQKIRIPIPLSELVKHKDFKNSLSKMLWSEPSYHSSDSVNLHDENPTVILGPMI
jgi:hypothetical protein